MIRLLKKSLSFQMLCGALFGIFLGLFLGDLCSVFAPWENAYIMILKITAIPYLICAVMHGIGLLTPLSAKNILQKGLLFISGMWAINISTMYLIAYLFPKGTDGTFLSTYIERKSSTINFTELLIPDNIFSALANNLVPAIVVFSLLIGISLIYLKGKEMFMDGLSTLVASLTTITRWIARITPIGTFLIIADRVGSMHLETFKQIGTYLTLYSLGTSLLVFWVIPRLVAMFTNFSASKWIKALSPLMIVAFTTNLVIVILPFLVEIIRKETESYGKKEETLADQIQGTVSVIFNLPLGSLFLAVFIFFVATFYNIPLSGSSQIQLFLTTFLTSLGAIGLGSWINSVNFLLDTLGLPLVAIDTYLATLPFTAGFQSLVSVMEIGSLSLLVVLSSNKFLKIDWKKVAKQVAVILIPVVLLIVVFKGWVRLPPITNSSKGLCAQTLALRSNTRIYAAGDTLPYPRTGDVFKRVLRSKILRVGYSPDTLPFSFLNQTGDLVGYDIAFAKTLAEDLGCTLELIPIQFSTLASDLNRGLYDIAMSAVSINESRLQKIFFSHPYLESRIALAMPKKLKKSYPSLAAILRDPERKLVVKKGSSYEQLARSIAPEPQIVVIDDYDDYTKNYPSGILLRGEFQLISWSLSHPDFAVVIPDPLIAKDVFGYATAQGADQWVLYLNLWLELKKAEQTTTREFDHWVLGKSPEHLYSERRWSIIRNVFGWDY